MLNKIGKKLIFFFFEGERTGISLKEYLHLVQYPLRTKATIFGAIRVLKSRLPCASLLMMGVELDEPSLRWQRKRFGLVKPSNPCKKGKSMLLEMELGECR